MLSPELGFRPRRGDWLAAAAVSAALFLLYALTAPRTVSVEDDGLFILSAYFLGVDHAPGFPLFVLLGKLATLLPIGSVAYRVHLLSALFGGLACGAAWLCARALTGARLPAYVASFTLGLSPVFWSQSIIAEVYTLNVLLFLGLLLLALQAAQGARVLPWMAFLFGLSLTNHWPLMLLVAPGLALLLAPRLREILRRAPLLLALFAAGLLPYAWMVWRTWQEPVISYLGPLENWREVWHMLSRGPYAEVDQKLSASWLDRLSYLPFVGTQLVVQLALVGTALAALGCVLQWRMLGRRTAAGLLAAFLGPSLGLVVLLNFDYDSFHQHVFHVYPLPAYAIAALWAAMGFAWCAERYFPRRAPAAAAALLALMLAWGARGNLRADFDWAARYANTILHSLPQGAAVFVLGDADLPPIAYLHMIENVRPDITLFQSKGIVFGNRLFHPLRADLPLMKERVRKLVDSHPGPVVFVMETYGEYAARDRWLFLEVDRSSTDPQQVTFDVPEAFRTFFEQSVVPSDERNGWAAYFQAELRTRYAAILGRSLPRDQPPDERTRHHLELLEKEFYGALGLAEGLLGNRAGVPPVGAIASLLDTARREMPADTPKHHVARYFYLRGLLRVAMGDRTSAYADLNTAVDILPVPQSPALELLTRLYREADDQRAIDALEERIRRRKS